MNYIIRAKVISGLTNEEVMSELSRLSGQSAELTGGMITLRNVKIEKVVRVDEYVHTINLVEGNKLNAVLRADMPEEQGRYTFPTFLGE